MELWSEDGKVMLMGNSQIEAWAYAYGARARHGAQAFAAYYEQLSDDSKACLQDDPEIQEALTGRRADDVRRLGTERGRASY